MVDEITQPIVVSLLNQGILKQLGQSRPSGTTAASIYSPASGIRAIVKTIFVANNTGSAATFRLFHDEDGTTYDESTALDFDVSVSANSTTLLTDLNIGMINSSGNLAVRTGTGNALTFTVYGEEFDIS